MSLSDSVSQSPTEMQLSSGEVKLVLLVVFSQQASLTILSLYLIL